MPRRTSRRWQVQGCVLSAFCLGERTPGANEGNFSATFDIRTPTEIRPARTAGAYLYRSCWRACRRVVFSPYLSIFRYRCSWKSGVLGQPSSGCPGVVAIAVLMASRSTASRSGTVAASAETWGVSPASGAHEGDLLRKLCCRNGVTVSQHDHAFDHVAHFTYVSRPGVSFECVDDVRLEAFHGYAVAMRHLPVEMLDQLGDVLLALAQRGDAEGGDGYTVEQVLAKTTGRDLRTKIPVGRGDQLELNVARLARPEWIQFSSFEDTQEIWLQFERRLADLVEKHVPPRAASILPIIPDRLAPVNAPST